MHHKHSFNYQLERFLMSKDFLALINPLIANINATTAGSADNTAAITALQNQVGKLINSQTADEDKLTVAQQDITDLESATTELVDHLQSDKPNTATALDLAQAVQNQVAAITTPAPAPTNAPSPTQPPQ